MITQRCIAFWGSSQFCSRQMKLLSSLLERGLEPGGLTSRKVLNCLCNRSDLWSTSRMRLSNRTQKYRNGRHYCTIKLPLCCLGDFVNWKGNLPMTPFSFDHPHTVILNVTGHLLNAHGLWRSPSTRLSLPLACPHSAFRWYCMYYMVICI